MRPAFHAEALPARRGGWRIVRHGPGWHIEVDPFRDRRMVQVSEAGVRGRDVSEAEAARGEAEAGDE